MEEPVWLDPRVVSAIHRDQLEQHGGARGVRASEALDAALGRARSKWAFEPNADIADVATAYAAGLAQGRAFNDGNERTALATMLTFLALNARDLSAPEHEAVVAIRRLSSPKADEAEFAAWLRRHLS